MVALTRFNPFRVLITHRNFRSFWIGQTLSLVGSWMQSMALGWLALELSDSAFVVGVVVASGSLPILAFSLYAGVLVDRSDKLRLVTIAQTLLLLEAVFLWWLTWSGHVTVGALIAMAAFGGAVASVEIPARQALMIDLVGRDDLRDAIALNSSGFNLARIIGPAVGAFIIANAGMAWCFAVNALSYLTVLAGLARVRLPPWQAPRMPGAPLQQMREGLTYALRDRPVRALLELVTAFSVLGIPYIALMPVLARDRLGLGAGGYGVMLSVLGIGGLTGALALAAAGLHIRRGPLVARTATTYATLLLILSFVRQPAVAYPILLATGFLMIVNNAMVNGMLQTMVPDEYRGRLMSIYSMIVVGLPQVIGAFSAGAVAGLVGVQWAIGGAALGMLAFNWLVFRRNPEIREL
ncbi:MAG TPA: MFS transporter [Gemmatimonadaceae bacterium]